MTKDWNWHVESLKSRLRELNETVDTIREAVEERPGLADATHAISSLLSSAESIDQGLSKFPQVVSEILENSVLGAVLIGPHGKFLLHNQTAGEILGYSFILHRSDDALIFEDEDGNHIPHDDLPWNIALSGEPISDKRLHIKTDTNDAGKWITFSATPFIENEDSIGGVMLFMLDTTEEVNLEESIESMCATISDQIAQVGSTQDQLQELASKLSKTGVQRLLSDRSGQNLRQEQSSSKKSIARPTDLESNDSVSTSTIEEDQTAFEVEDELDIEDQLQEADEGDEADEADQTDESHGQTTDTVESTDQKSIFGKMADQADKGSLLESSEADLPWPEVVDSEDYGQNLWEEYTQIDETTSTSWEEDEGSEIQNKPQDSQEVDFEEFDDPVSEEEEIQDHDEDEDEETPADEDFEIQLESEFEEDSDGTDSEDEEEKEEDEEEEESELVDAQVSEIDDDESDLVETQVQDFYEDEEEELEEEGELVDAQVDQVYEEESYQEDKDDESGDQQEGEMYEAEEFTSTTETEFIVVPDEQSEFSNQAKEIFEEDDEEPDEHTIEAEFTFLPEEKAEVKESEEGQFDDDEEEESEAKGPLEKSLLGKRKPRRPSGTYAAIGGPNELDASYLDEDDDPDVQESLVVSYSSKDEDILRPTTNKVLVVDDIPVNQKLLLLHLKRLGFEADVANNGKEALEALAKQEYQVVLMDCDMPVMNGFDAASKIRATEAYSHRRVPIIALTSYDREGDREKCLAAGMDDYITKGSSRKELKEVIDKFIVSSKEGSDSDENAEINQEIETETEPLDINSMLKLYGREEVEEISRLFLSNMAAYIDCMQLAIDEKDSDSVIHFANAVKEPCAALGMKLMTRLTTEIIELSEKGDWTQVRLKYMRLKAVFVQTQEEIKRFAPTIL